MHNLLTFLASDGYSSGEVTYLFNTPIHLYAVCILIGVAIALWLGLREGKKLGIASDDIYLGLIIILPIAIIGARLWYVIFNIDEFPDFLAVLGFQGGEFTGLAGLAIHGGVIFAAIAIVIYCRVKRISFFKVMDIVAPGFLIGQICGRWGNFFNHELYGPVIENSVFLKNIPFIGDMMLIDGEYRHPTFLYESALNLVGLILILVGRRKFKFIKTGDFIGFYLCWYGVVRIFTESLRMQSGVDEPLMIGSVPVSILISIIFIVVGILYLVFKRLLPKMVKANKDSNTFVKELANIPQESYVLMVERIKNDRFDTILFDNDGTLLNTKDLIDRSFIHTFEKFRPDHKLTEEELDSFFGPTLYQTFSKYGESEEEIQEMIQYYREFNEPNHDYFAKAFPYAKELLMKLHKKGYKIGVVSSKKNKLLAHGLEHFGLLEYVDIVVGADDVTNHKPAPDSLLFAKEKLNGNNVLYVGDTLNDILAAKNAKMKSVGVLYIKHPEIMLDAKPDYVISNLNELLRILGE